MESAGILHYLLDIVQTDGLSNMAKLASLTCLSKLFTSEKGYDVQYKCLKADITTSLISALDIALCPKCDPADLEYVTVAMEVMWKLSKLPIGAIQDLVAEAVIRRLLMFLDISWEFYQFQSTAKSHLAVLCENKQLIGKVKVVSMATEPLDYIHRHTKNKLKRLPRLPGTVKVCHMYDTECEEDLDITQYMLQHHIAWPGTFPGDVSHELDDWQDIVITEVLDGGMFWAQVGEHNIKKVFEIQQQLNCDVVLEQETCPRSGDLVVVKGVVMDTQCYLRAQILLQDVRHVEVYAVDYGYRMTVADTQLYKVPDNLTLTSCHRTISLCTVAGIQPPPLDEALVQNAAAILTNLCKQSYNAGEILKKLNGLEIIDRLLRTCQRSKVMVQVTTLLNNLACNTRLIGYITDRNLVKVLLGIIERISSEMSGELEGDDKVLVARCLMCMTNVLYRNPDTREQFYKCQGIDTTVRLLKKVGRQDTLFKMAAKLFKILIGHFMLTKTTSTDNTTSASNTARSSTQDRRSSDTGIPGNRLATDYQRTQTHTTAHKPRHHVDSSSDSECEDDNLSIKGNPRLCLPIDQSSTPYILGSKVKVTDDDTHELCPVQHINKVKSLAIAEHVCGMLNTGQGGHVYFGIDKDQQVFGIELSREERDCFRLGIDSMMYKRMSPMLLHSQFDFTPSPVIDPDTQKVVPDLYVIELCVKASRGVVYLLEGLCYYRFGSKTSTISRLELRQLIILEEESYYIDEINRLERRKTELFTQMKLDNVLHQ